MLRSAALEWGGRLGMLSLVMATMLQPVQPVWARAGEGPDTVTASAPIGPYQPADADERGLWMQVENAERDMRASQFVIRDPALNAYVRGVLCREVGQDKCAEARIYITRTPYFNASMAPNGMMQVWSGLLLRMENEAQLAAVLGHEFTHYEERHSVRLFRDWKAKSNAAGWLGLVPFGFIAQLGIIATLFTFSREMERDADSGSIRYLAKGGYDTREASRVWARLRSEMDATAVARQAKSRKDKTGGLFATHPPTLDRVEELIAQAKANPGTPGEVGEERYRAAMAPYWSDMVDDQLKMNDFGASEFLLTQLADEVWTAPLLYARAELYRRRGGAGDLEKAVAFYDQAIAAGGAAAEIWRGRGLSRAKLGRGAEGKADLDEYLRRAPEARDRTIIAAVSGGLK